MANISDLSNAFRQTSSQGLGSPMLPTQEVWQSKNPNAAGTALLTRYSGGTQPGDVLGAMRADAGEFNRQAGEMRAARDQGLGALDPFVSGEATAGAKERAGESAERLTTGLQERTGRARESIGDAREAAQALGPEAEQRREEALAAQEQHRVEALQEAERMKEEALQDYSDDTAIAIQSQRATLGANLNSQKRQVLDQAARQGLGPDSPEVQQQLRQLDMEGSQQLGQLAGQAALQYNDTRTKLRMTHDEMSTRIRGLQDQLSATVRADADKYTGLSQSQGAQLMGQVAQLSEGLEMAAQQEYRATEQLRAQNELAADQLRLAGAEGMANFVNNWEYAMAPMAPIVALAAQMTADLNQQAGLGAMSVASGITPSVGAMDIMSSGGSPAGSSYTAANRIGERPGTVQGGSPTSPPQSSFWQTGTPQTASGGTQNLPWYGGDVDPAGETLI